MSKFPGQIADLSPQKKRELLTQLLREKASKVTSLHPLSHGQQALWFLYRIAPESASYNIALTFRIHSKLNITALKMTFQAILDRHAILRATFSTQNTGEPVQEISGYKDICFKQIDSSSWDQDTLNRNVVKAYKRPFDLERGPVLRVSLFTCSAKNHILLLSMHHIAGDSWSLIIMMEELRVLYPAKTSGTRVSLPPLNLLYTDYVRKQTEMLESPAGDRLWAYWRQQLAGDLPVINLPTDYPRPPVQTYHGASYYFELTTELSQKLKELARVEGVTLYMFLLAAFLVLLYRYTGQEDILVGSPAAGRNWTEFAGVVGYFVNQIVLRADLSGNPSFKSFLSRVRKTVLAALEHQDYPFSLIVKRLHLNRESSRSPLSQVAFTLRKFKQFEKVVEMLMADKAGVHINWGGLELESFKLAQQEGLFDLTLEIVKKGESFFGIFKYQTDLFKASTIARLAGHFQILLESIVLDPVQNISQLSLFTKSERQKLLLTWNDTQMKYPRKLCIHELFEAQVQRTPAARAIVFETQQLSYHELNNRANKLANYLHDKGVGPEVLVGIYVERSLEMVIGILGVLKAGGAYVPMDPGYPVKRIAFMLDDARVPVLLTQKRLLENLPECKARVICLDSDWKKIVKYSAENPDYKVAPVNLAYVIYTSGSTGRPKGVQIQHNSVVNFLYSMCKQPGITKEDICLSVTTLSFDIAVLEIFLPLMVGAGIILVNRKTVSNGRQLLEKLVNSDATIMQATPSTWELLLEAGWEGSDGLKILCGGEPLSRVLANQLIERSASLWNLYGPTETTIWSTIHKVESGNGSVSIGCPIANTQVYLLDAHLQPVPPGVAGELYIGGNGLARGYLNRPNLTAKKFIPDPFRDKPGARLYKTGDLARYLPEGTIQFLGRIDHQVKIRGFRIELGEIETVLNQHPSVQKNLVVVHGEESRERRLVAYIVPAYKSVSGEKQQPQISINELMDFLKKQLPGYMVPSVFMFLDAIPLTPNGKVNRQALPVPGMTRPVMDAAFVEPRNQTEKLLAEIWAKVLSIDKVGIHDNFFDLGGASIQTLKVVNQANNAGLQLSPELIFKHQTIAELAKIANPSAQNHGNKACIKKVDPHIIAGLNTNNKTLDDMNTVPGINSQMDECNIIIESLGIYLPPKVVSTKDVLKGCRKKVLFPLERMTGIKYRRMAGEVDFSIDLAKKAVSDCMARSKYNPEDIELLICCNISRYDGPNHRFSFEPNTSIKISKHFGFNNALAFDITNACAGVFTAINIVDVFIKAKIIRCAMVVSGEYISHLINTAQKEIEGFMDLRLACLTVGDAGAALILEESSDDSVGFHDIDMYTVSKYSSLCYAKITDKEHGGAIMFTDPVKQTAVSINQAVRHSDYILNRGNWTPESFQHIIMHQTSEMAINDAVRAINNFYNRKICHKENTIYNLAERGNTATTTHFVALKDNIINNRIKTGDKIIFAITGSGQTIGTALYTFDDLPDRMRLMELTAQKPEKFTTGERNDRIVLPDKPRIRIESIGTISEKQKIKRDAIEMAKMAAKDCLEKSSYDRNDIHLLLHTGIYRNEFLSEPAIAALLAGELKINDEIRSTGDKRTLAFDVFNSSLGFLNSCYVAIQFIRANKYKNAMVVASEIENNADIFPEKLRGIKETGSAVILDKSNNNKTGFGNFVFKNYTDYIDTLSSYTKHENGKTYLQIDNESNIEDLYINCIPHAVYELLTIEQIDFSQIKVIFPPQISLDFLIKLSKRMNITKDKFIDISPAGKDYFTSSMVYALRYAFEHNMVEAGDIGLIINVGTGIQIGCSTYYF